ncbi:FAD-binding oxidoreductase [Neobacillus sp. FSL H8-0543]|uniref:FAD-binding oxidoreductase n=1 Tax=Neobacillus sp. FSL H8-0543 TaxID=2954672 RepID=UPI0031590812
MVTVEYLSEIKKLVNEEQIRKEENTDHPLGNSGQITIFPKTEEEISALLNYANTNGLSISIMGGGSKRGFGGQVKEADIQLSLIQYSGIVEHIPGDMTLTVKSGTYFKEIQSYLAQYNQKIPLDPFFLDNATIGGVIATNDSGPKRLGYGSARDAVIGLRMVYPDGKVIRSGGRVVKNVAGYDMNKLYIGSMGTLGVISEVTFKLRPISKYGSITLINFPEGNLEVIRSFAVKVLDSMIEPVSFELLNPTLAKKLTNKKHYTLLLSFEDVKSSVQYQEDYIKSIAPHQTNLSYLTQKEEMESFWKQFYQIHPDGNKGLDNNQTEATLKIGVVNLDIIKILQESDLIQDLCNVSIHAHGCLGNGLCQMTIGGASNDVVRAIQLVRERAEKLGGYAVIKHLPYALRQEVNVWGAKTASHFLFAGIKQKIDPNRILNRNRFVEGI